jgi:uncharacterized RDD family membrane protein YckC
MENENFQFNREAIGGFSPVEPRGTVSAGFSERFLAYVIDSLPFVSGAYLTFAVIAKSGFARHSFATGNSCKLIWIALYLLYETLLSSGGRVTLGKYFMGLRVKDADGSDLSVTKAFIRSVSYFASAAPLNLGYIIALFTPDKRALHDYLGGSRVFSIKGRSDRADGVLLVVSWALMAMLAGSWINQNLLRMGFEEKKVVAAARTTISKVAKLEEIHKTMYGGYTGDMKRLAALTGNPVAVRNEIIRTITPNTLVITTDGRAYVISAKARNWRKTEVRISRR